MNSRMRLIVLRRGLTLLELMVVISIIGVLISMFAVGVQNAREAARRMSCSNQLKQIGIAIQNYHAAYNQLPLHGSGSGVEPGIVNIYAHSNRTNQLGLSIFVGMLPFLEQQALWETISNPLNLDAQGNTPPAVASLNGGPFFPMGPSPSAGHHQYLPWVTEISTLRCASDPGVGLPALGRTNYAACIGDNGMKSHIGPVNRLLGHEGSPGVNNVKEVNRYCRGVFVTRKAMAFKDILDGTSQTLMCGEITTDLGDNDARTRGSFSNTRINSELPGATFCRANKQLSVLQPHQWDPRIFPRHELKGPNDAWPAAVIPTVRRGFSWASFANMHTAFTTLLPPNSELCVAVRDELTPGNWSASSRHQGGVHGLFADGAVRFITDSIDSGDSTFPATLIEAGEESPYGVWGAIGTRGNREKKNYFD